MPLPTDIDLRAQARQLTQEGAGLIEHGRTSEARLVLRQALALQPGLADAHCHLGHALQQIGQVQEALHAYRQALACDAGHLPAHLRLAVLLQELGKQDEAVTAYRHVLDRNPDLPDVHYNLGVLLDDMGRHLDAEVAYRHAIRLRPDHAETHQNLGALLVTLGRLADAEASCRQALALQPQQALAHGCLAAVLALQNQLPQAEAHYRQATVLDAGNAQTHESLGAILHRQNKYAQAETAYRRALALKPADTGTWNNLGTVLDQLNRLPESESAFRQALALRPDFADAHFGLALVLLRQGRLAEAWPLYEFRYHPQRQSRLSHWATPPLDCPPWRGEPLAGKSLVIWQEQGHGDVIQFGRYLSQLKALGARRLTLVCMDPLKPLFEQQAAVDAVVAIRKSATLDDVRALLGHDYWTFIMSLPHGLGTTLDTIPPAAYLQPGPAHLERWRTRLAGLAGKKIGLVWKGNAGHSNDHNRSLPGLRTLAPLWEVPGLSFISLQKGQGEDQARVPPPGQALLHLGSDLDDFADSAALVAQLDLLICVDTAVAHVAGALGIPCWVLVPAEGTDWRWMLEDETTPWYPGTMRLFRQAAPGDWAGPVEQLRRALLTRYPARSAASPISPPPARH
ncbi:MAG TPA: tetratricopeptide repeat protein [Bordetella sp.]